MQAPELKTLLAYPRFGWPRVSRLSIPLTPAFTDLQKQSNFGKV